MTQGELDDVGARKAIAAADRCRQRIGEIMDVIRAGPAPSRSAYNHAMGAVDHLRQADTALAEYCRMLRYVAELDDSPTAEIPET